MSKHFEHSMYREKMIEHLFIGELLKLSWQVADCDLEIARAEVDNSGYDIIAEKNGVMRHIQLKSSYEGSTTPHQKIQTRLMTKPSGCVVWIIFSEDTMELKEFLFFGGAAGQRMTDISNYPLAKHTKGDKDGVKKERKNIRKVSKGKFTSYKSIEEIYEQLFSVEEFKIKKDNLLYDNKDYSINISKPKIDSKHSIGIRWKNINNSPGFPYGFNQGPVWIIPDNLSVPILETLLGGKDMKGSVDHKKISDALATIKCEG